ncbi:DUF2076 domain-containing protein [Klebsiella quasipneumoniae]|uniref:DUF2076 domain-containing protein n=1 Tax=Klebsiella TaxID=570 RepID=UPI000C79D982|nr:DUF2076 domain-containing protein [Klebsiella quasipneumoniae]HBR1668461.1 DUF2076 domain-containing protein [Klebsiella quasipneumoniae subsp. quasipneumoniae]MEC5639014.1 DUF2076 domain-containing protein [Klebsiella quasipneumoniae]PLK56499.1 DUF2076 domain-containing protein [Klebsiella quasipneumoniae]PLM37523.1 DUF2076 domain-containing protein [Klebsiella quasipneumoniae]HCB1266595.1 DUF2076 domain-containing protein [Klebsiella quasipneumoniae subsp. quasipneumoniae]
MQSEEQRLIDGLFSRLKEAEAHSASRDASAEERIAQHVSAQPAAPYYMAQTILIQEAAIKQLNDRIQALESQVSQLQAAKPSSGGFLSGLFGGGSSRGSDPIPGAEQYGRPQASAQPQYAPQQQQSYAPQAAARGGGFMAGALQTAAGVAGGVVLGNMLTNMFSGSHPQEIVNIIEEKPQPDAAAQDAAAGDDPFRQGDDQFLADNTWNDDFDAGFGDDDIGSDDDSWV